MGATLSQDRVSTKLSSPRLPIPWSVAAHHGQVTGAGVAALDPAALAALPASVQLELLKKLREQRFAENQAAFQRASNSAPQDFSQLQLATFLKVRPCATAGSRPRPAPILSEDLLPFKHVIQCHRNGTERLSACVRLLSLELVISASPLIRRLFWHRRPTFAEASTAS